MASPATQLRRELGLNPQDQIVTITVDPNSGKIKVDPEVFHLSKKEHQEVVWHGDPQGTDFTVQFDPNDTPFHGYAFSRECPSSGLVRDNVQPNPNKTYKYAVTVGAKAVDPGGIIYP